MCCRCFHHHLFLIRIERIGMAFLEIRLLQNIQLSREHNVNTNGFNPMYNLNPSFVITTRRTFIYIHMRAY
jgi:hypothetical protein